jgi:hypothetical protein
MILDKEEKYILQETNTLLRHQESLLFQRFNYFLISNSFLTTAFITLAFTTLKTTDTEVYKTNLNLITIVLGIAGILLSWLFCAINIHNAKIISALHSYAREREKELSFNQQYVSDLPYSYLKDKILRDQNLIDYFSIILLEPFIQLFKPKNRLAAPHAWGIPFLFFIIWILLIIFYLK